MTNESYILSFSVISEINELLTNSNRKYYQYCTIVSLVFIKKCDLSRAKYLHLT